ncbi:MAG: type I-U CRISPR-associated helicase/endonuclease Cas3 [Candidatus Binataceae bacterium]|nr:type I-U CRISPR-associated helicase/endonuclease Cas3 [Candidatus Binataceae bacterium]
MNPDLRPDEFREFFSELHGLAPFPWQERLAQRVFAEGWPRALDIPTGAGKTAAIDVAVFHLALEATRGAERHAAVRILFVVDRRLVVDDAYERAQMAATKLAEAKEGVLRRVADRLRFLAEDEDHPLAVARLRGGMPKEPDWVRTPAQPTVVVSTVDQVGSRLLFRGYGVSDSMKPIHAGLLGCDTLLLLDEAHLSQPFVQTARDTLIFRKEPWSGNAAAAPFGIVTLSATYAEDTRGEPGEQPFRITDEDRGDPQLGKRLRASKPAELIETKASEAALPGELADKALEFTASIGGGSIVAVVVNRVKRARAIFEALQQKDACPFGEKHSDDVSSPEVALLTGRVRDLDREELLTSLLPFVKVGPRCTPRTRPLIIVATQCIEAGADLDFDALVTEIAPLDCLRQRFGRLNRMGRDINVQAAIIARADQIRKSAEPDPIYGAALGSTWGLLIEKSASQGKGKTARHFIDFGIDRSASWFPDGDTLVKCLAPRKDAPVLLPSAIDFWSRTSPRPAADPEVPLYLHGPESGPPDVEIVWRADLDDDVDEGYKQDLWRECISVCPPSSLEAVSVPISEARRWLRGQPAGELADVEAGIEEPEQRFSSLPWLRWRGKSDEGTKLIRDDLQPGDIIIVPASRGGCDRWGWAPGSKAGVKDLARKANLQQRGRDIFRLTKAELDEQKIGSTAEMTDWPYKAILDQFRKYSEGTDEAAFAKPRVIRASDGRPLAIERKLLSLRRKTQSDSSGEAVTEDDESLRAGRQKSVTLGEHSKGVESYARRFAEQAGLPSSVAHDLILSAYLHDAGKAQKNFKLLLYGADEVAANFGTDLAKSAKLPDSPRDWDKMRIRAGLPKGARHEIASLRFAEAHPRFTNADDPDLVLWLIGTHHGYGRPFFPPPERDWPGEGDTFATDLGDGRIVSKPARSLADLTAAWLDISERLKRRYGVWGLARLEAILRLADHRRSEAEQDEDRP